MSKENKLKLFEGQSVRTQERNETVTNCHGLKVLAKDGSMKPNATFDTMLERNT